MAKEFTKGFTIYKPKRDGCGSASQWNLGSEKDCVFLEMASQNNDDQAGKFDWENKLIFKLGETDIGEILSVLAGGQVGVGPLDRDKGKHKGLFHSNPKGNAVMYLVKDKDLNCFKLCLSIKRDNKRTACMHNITRGEAYVLEVLLKQAVRVMAKWY